MDQKNSFRPIDAQARIGHVHLKVSDLERSLKFYRDVLGFEITTHYGSQAVFLSAGGYHHHIGLNTWDSLLAAGIELDGASDHGVSEALYLRDPDDNGVELYWDRPREQWPRAADGGIEMFTRQLDVDSLLGLDEKG
jgi:catechol 2,3-dioxygenase